MARLFVSEDVEECLEEERAGSDEGPFRLRVVTEESAAGAWRRHAGSLRRLLGGAVVTVGVVWAICHGAGAAGGLSGDRDLASAGHIVGLARDAASNKRCHTTKKGEGCYKAALWAKTDGIYGHPDWYPHLSKHSGIAQFQAAVHSSSTDSECPHAPCREDLEAEKKHEEEAAKAAKAAASASPAPSSPASGPASHHAAAAAPAPAPAFRFVTSPPAGGKHGVYRWNISCAPPLVPVPKPVRDGKSDHQTMSCDCPPPQVLDTSSHDPVCRDPTGMSKMTFYVYRAQGDSDYPPENVNVADLAGVMWYLHNEVVPSVPRKFGVTRILRYKLTIQNTEEFYNKYPKQFGPFVAFDSAKCTAPDCNDIWNDYGFVIGCQNLDRYVVNVVRDYQPPAETEVTIRKLEEQDDAEDHERHGGDAGRHDEQHRRHEEAESHRKKTSLRPKTEAWTTTTHTTTTQTKIHDSFHSGIWYSLPGACPEATIHEKSEECVKRMPGGRCSGVDGSKDCTYDIEPAGEISLDKLSGILDEKNGITSYDDWWKNSYTHCLIAVQRGEREGPCQHKMEYNTFTDQGVGTDFWNGKHDLEQGLRRMNRVRELFLEKYPNLPTDLAEPACL